MTEIYLDQTWQQVNPQRSVDAASFKQGSILFNFNVSGLNSVSMRDSYFVIKSSLVRQNSDTPTAINPHKIEDKVTYANNWCSALFSSVSVRVSGQEVSQCNQYNHIAHTLKLRSLIDENKISNNLRDSMDYDPDFTRRLYKHTNAGPAAATVNFPTTSATPPFPTTSMREDGLTEMANKGATNIRNGDASRYTIYQPLNLGVFDLGHGALCGDISILLNPNPNYETFCVESARFAGDDFEPATNAIKTGGSDGTDGKYYSFKIHSISFMAAYAKASKPIDSIKTFTVHEYQVMNKAYAEQLEFNVVPSTEEITVLIQDQSAGQTTDVPATSFKVKQYTHAQLNDHAVLYGKAFSADENGSIQCTLGSQTKPPIMLEPAANKIGENGQIVRWLMSNQYLDGHKAIFERYNDWISSPYYSFSFLRDSSDTSGYVTVRSKYTKSENAGGTKVATVDWPNGLPYLFCVSKYSKIVKIEYNSGYVTSIQIQNS